MTDAMLSHLAAWCAKYDERGFDMFTQILDFVRDHPDVTDRHGWPEVYDLATR